MLRTCRPPITFVFGLPRSGTTWLAKILDSHPDVLYRHEPDIGTTEHTIPFYPETIDEHLDDARLFVDELIRNRSRRVAASRPMFRKAYHTWPKQSLRCLIACVSWLGAYLGIEILVPDFTDEMGVHVVIKSVISMGRAGLLLGASGANAIIILRHPCAQITSVLRGTKTGKQDIDHVRWPILTKKLPTRSFSRAEWEAMTPVENLAWKWVIGNTIALKECPSAFVIRHEDLCFDPVGSARAIFEYLGLSWSEQTDRFLVYSTTGSSSYFGIRRDSRKESMKRFDGLADGDAEIVRAITENSLPGQFYRDEMIKAS